MVTSTHSLISDRPEAMTFDIVFNRPIKDLKLNFLDGKERLNGWWRNMFFDLIVIL